MKNYRTKRRKVMKKQLTALLTAVVMALGMCGCSEKKDDSEGLEYIGRAKLSADIEEALKAKYNTLTVTENLNIVLPEKLSDMQFKARRFNEADANKLIEHHGFKGKAVFEDNNDPHNEYLIRYQHQDGDQYSQFIIQKDGFVNIAYYHRTPDPETVRDTNDKDRKSIFVKDIKPGDTVTVNGSTGDLSEMVAKAQELVNGHAEAAGDLCKYVPIYVFCEPWRIRIEFVQYFDGYSFPCYNTPILDDDPDPVKAGLKVVGESCGVFFIDVDRPNGIVHYMNEMPPEYVGEEFKETVSLSSALRYLDNYMAEGMDLQIDDISIVQMNKDQTPKTITEEEVDQFDFNAEFTAEMHPSWQFIMHSGRSEEERFAALIDCTTGQFSFSKITF